MSGLTDHGEGLAIAGALPNGTARYVGFFTVEPTADDGTGGTEATGSGYARKSHSAWTTTTVGEVTYGINNGAVTFTALTADLEDIVAWGVWDAASGGNLIAFGPLLDVAGNEITQTFTSGNNPQFPDGELKVGID